MKRTATTFLILALILSCCACNTSSITGYETLPTVDRSNSDTTNITEVTDSTMNPATEPATESSGENTIPPTTDIGTMTEPTTPIPPAPSNCSHDYHLVSVEGSTCTENGKHVFYCNLCGDGYYIELPLSEHQFAEATCTTPTTCIICGIIQGADLGHNFINGSCVNCGIGNSDQGPVGFIITVDADNGTKMSGITVSVYTDSTSTPAGTGVTNNNGIATITLPHRADSYKVVLTDIPSGYSAQDSYRFTTPSCNITLSTFTVSDPTDHSKANYQVGSIMSNFSLTDVDGVTHSLSDLLASKKLIILHFWHIDSAPCKAEFPYFESVYNEYAEDVALLALDPVGIDNNTKIAALKDNLGLSFPMMCDTSGLHLGINIQCYPTTVFIDGSGRILEIRAGSYNTETELRTRIQNYL